MLQSETPYFLLSIYGPYTGKKYSLDKEEIKIGRDKEMNDIVIRQNKKGKTDTSISRRHATVFMRGGKYFISDKRSKTRTFVNQNKLSEDDEVELNEKDEIEIVSDSMSTIFRFVPEGEWDFSYPKKAGVWYVRFRPYIRLGASVILCLFFLNSLFSSLGRWQTLSQTPGSLSMESQVWMGPDILEDSVVEGSPYSESDRTVSPAIADLNGDGRIDMAVVNKSGHLVGIDCRTRKLLWPKSRTHDIQVQPATSVALADMTGNGLEEILVAARNSQVYVCDGSTGHQCSGWDPTLLGGVLSSGPVVGDLNGDGYNDVIVSSESGRLYWRYARSDRDQWERIETGFRIFSSPAIVGIEAENRMGVILGTDRGRLVEIDIASRRHQIILDINEALRQALRANDAPNAVRNGIAFGEVDGNRMIVTSTRQYRVGAFLRDQDGWSRAWVGTFDNPGQRYPTHYGSPVMGDLTDDGRLDVVIAYHNGVVKTFECAGSVSQEKDPFWTFQPSRADRFIATPALADLTKDGTLDVIVGGSEGFCYVLDGKNGKLLWESRNLGSSVLSTPVVGDVDGNGRLDILLHTFDGSLHKIESNAKTMKNTVVWGQEGYNAARANRFDYVKPGAGGAFLQFIVSVIIVCGVLYINLRSISDRKKRIAA